MEVPSENLVRQAADGKEKHFGTVAEQQSVQYAFVEMHHGGTTMERDRYLSRKYKDSLFIVCGTGAWKFSPEPAAGSSD